MERRTVETEHFAAQDAAGNSYIIVKRQTQMRVAQISSPVSPWCNGTYDWVTIDGMDVDELKDGTFKILNIDVLVRRVE